MGFGQLAILFFVLAEMAGGFTLARLGPAFDVGVAGALRPWLVLLAIFCVLFAYARPGFRRHPVLRLAMGISVLHLVLLLSLFWSARQVPNGEEVLHVCMMVLAMPFAAMVFAERTEEHQEWILKLLFLIGVAALPVAVAGFTAVSAELNLRAVGSIRIARTAGLAAVAALALGLRGRSWLWLIPVPVWVLVMLASGNRASLLAFGLAGIPLLFSTRRVQALSGAAVMGMVAVAVVLTIPVAGEIVRFFFQQALWEADGRIYFADRGILFRTAWVLFARSPWVGSGLGGYAAMAGNYYEYPHNLTLSFASEMGLLGLVPYLVLLWVTFRAFGLDRSPIHLGVVGVFVYLFVAAQFSGTYGDSFFMWVSALAIYGVPRAERGEVPAA